MQECLKPKPDYSEDKPFFSFLNPPLRAFCESQHQPDMCPWCSHPSQLNFLAYLTAVIGNRLQCRQMGLPDWLNRKIDADKRKKKKKKVQDVLKIKLGSLWGAHWDHYPILKRPTQNETIISDLINKLINKLFVTSLKKTRMSIQRGVITNCAFILSVTQWSPPTWSHIVISWVII